MALKLDDVAPLTKTGISQMLVDKLLGYVVAGQLRPGDRLPSERDLAERFGVSRPTVREAIRALAVLGILEPRHGGGVFVTALDAADLLGPLTFFLSLTDVAVEKLYQARRLIEGEICALAAVNISEAEITELSALIDEQERARPNAERWRNLDSRFHRRLAEIAGNPFFTRSSQSMNILGLEFRKVASETERVLSASIDDHKAIVAALEARDGEAARRAMAAHMDQVLRTTRAAMEKANG